jgi:hypothetical protein
MVARLGEAVVEQAIVQPLGELAIGVETVLESGLLLGRQPAEGLVELALVLASGFLSGGEAIEQRDHRGHDGVSDAKRPAETASLLAGLALGLVELRQLESGHLAQDLDKLLAAVRAALAATGSGTFGPRGRAELGTRRAAAIRARAPRRLVLGLPLARMI